MKPSFKQLFKSYIVITLGSAIYALSYDAFFAPNLVAMGGVTGLAQVINALAPFLTVGTLVFCMNVPLFLAGWKYIGGHLLISSVYATTLSSVFIDFFAAVYTFPSMDPMLASICGGVTMGLGLGLVFLKGATTGGTDIIARLLKLKFTWLPIGSLILIPDFVIIALAAMVFRQLETALYGLIALYISTKVMDMVLYGMDTSKVAFIISDHHADISDAIMKMDRGATLLHGEGAWSRQEKNVLMVAFKQKEIVPIKQLVHDADPAAFMIVCDAHDVLGEGFRIYNKNDI